VKISYVPVPASAYRGGVRWRRLSPCRIRSSTIAVSGGPHAGRRREGPWRGHVFTFLNLLTWSSVNLPELPHDINDHRHKALHGTNNFTQQNGFHIAHAARVTDIVERRRRRSRRCRVAHNWLHNHNDVASQSVCPYLHVCVNRYMACPYLHMCDQPVLGRKSAPRPVSSKLGIVPNLCV
jgi:hypothetical protein